LQKFYILDQLVSEKVYKIYFSSASRMVYFMTTLLIKQTTATACSQWEIERSVWENKKILKLLQRFIVANCLEYFVCNN